MPTPTEDLRATADAATAFIAEHDDGASGDVLELLDELRTAVDAARRVAGAVESEDPLGAYAFLRVVLESAVRLRWVAGDGDEPDLETLRGRLARQRRGDAERFRTALNYTPDTQLQAEARRRMDEVLESLPGPASPATIRALATRPESRMLYAAHRLCSSVIHPGIGIRRIDLMRVADATEMATGALELATAITASSAGVLDRG